ncbi:MAG: class III poly(R)-hydroxyalkanoic acid synthase subunit PhaC [Eubacteriaceae bacterium]|jgi:polyhydroxyalkanoate synthase|nr:class III poly(R)-hydroxyalkanoic acid synthase subunit PhaC [Eubacteriaceae bacterium]
MNQFLDIKKSFEEGMEAQKKMLKSLETMVNIKGDGSNRTEREIVYQEDKLTLYHYTKRVKRGANKVPTLIVYALVNTPAMMDLQEDKSFIKNLLDEGADLYLIEWGYPTPDDRYLGLEDYIQGYIDNCVDFICKEHKTDKINLLGVCQGGTFSVMYAALNPKKVKNLITMVTPVDFSTDDGLLFKWGKYLNADKMVEAYGNLPGDFLNTGFLTLKPISLVINKYLDLIDDLDSESSMDNFLTMEKWIFDSPNQAGRAFKEFINGMYKENKLIKGEMEIGGEKVDLKNINMPLLNVYAERDHQVPNAASKPLEDYVSSLDTTTKCYPTGHIGLFVSGRSQREVAPFIGKWLKDHDK